MDIAEGGSREELFVTTAVKDVLRDRSVKLIVEIINY